MVRMISNVPGEVTISLEDTVAMVLVLEADVVAVVLLLVVDDVWLRWNKEKQVKDKEMKYYTQKMIELNTSRIIS